MDCQQCGRSPAREIIVRRHVGMLVMQRFFKVRAQLCRSCGWKLVRGWTGRTLVQGWWGYVSFFANIFTVLMNVVSAVKVLRLPRPQLSAAAAAFEDDRDVERFGWGKSRAEV